MATTNPANSSELQEIYALIAQIQPILSNPPTAGSPPIPRTTTEWMARVSPQKSGESPLAYPRISLFAAHHGFTRPQFPNHFENYVNTCSAGTARLNKLAEGSNADLRLYELTPHSANANAFDGPSLAVNDLARAMAYGMISVEPEIDFIAAGGFGEGSQTSAEALLAIHTNQTSSTDLAIARLIKANNAQRGLASLLAIGGLEMAALCGVILAARLAGCPVLLEGKTGQAALMALMAENPALGDHCALCGAVQEIEPSPVLVYRTDFALPDEPGVALAYHIAQIRTELLLPATPQPQTP